MVWIDHMTVNAMNLTLLDVDEIKVDVEFERHTGALEAVSMDETTQN